MPLDEKASDVFHWQTTLVTDNAGSLARRVLDGRYHLVSAGVGGTDGVLGFRRAFLVCDPDARVMLIHR
jgi:hypothetical protein